MDSTAVLGAAALLSRLSLRALLVVGALAMACVFAVAIGFGSFHAVRSRILADAIERYEMLARGLAAAFDQFLTLHLGAVTSAADEIGGIRRLDADALLPVITRMRAHHPAFLGVAVTDTAGIVVVSDPAFVADGRRGVGMDLSNRAWFREMRLRPAPSVDRRVLMAHVRPVPIVTVNAPLLDRDGAMRGAISAALDLDAVDRIAGAIRIGTTGYAQVAAADGIALVHPRREWVTEQKDFSKTPIWAHVSASDAGRVPHYVGSLGDVRVAGYATVPGVGWKIWVNRALADVEADVWRAYARVVGWSVLAFAGVGVVASLVAFAVVTPIRRLQVRASAIARGSLHQQVPEHGPAEVAGLARAFNAMSEALAQREHDLKESEARYRLLFERNVVGMFRTLADGTVLECNEAFARILGYRSPEEACRANAREFYAREGVRAEVVRQLEADGSVNDFEAEARRRDGSVVPVLMSVRRVPGDDMAVHEGTLIDLTERKRAEEATALRSVAELANGAAHEVNNPLAVLFGELDLLQRSGIHDPARVDRAHQAAERIRDIVAHMARITRLERAEGWAPGTPPMLDIRRSAPNDTAESPPS